MRTPLSAVTARAASLVVLVVLTATSGCSRDPHAAYCDTVEEHQKALTEIAAAEGSGSLLDALPAYRDLAEDAPRDIAGDWDQVVAALAALETALADADVDPTEYDAAEPPSGLAADQRDAIERAAEDLGSEATVGAMARVEQHALDVCGTPLSR